MQYYSIISCAFSVHGLLHESFSQRRDCHFVIVLTLEIKILRCFSLFCACNGAEKIQGSQFECSLWSCNTLGRGSHVFWAITVIKNPIVVRYRNKQHSKKKQYLYFIAVPLLIETRKELEFSLTISFAWKCLTMRRRVVKWMNSRSQVNWKESLEGHIAYG